MLVFPGLVLVTDAISAMGLPPGCHPLGQRVIEIQGLHAYVKGLFLIFSSSLRQSNDFPYQPDSGCMDLETPLQCQSFCLLDTKTLGGSIATMDMCVKHFRQASGECVLIGPHFI